MHRMTEQRRRIVGGCSVVNRNEDLKERRLKFI
jgi:hypothetical protein